MSKCVNCLKEINEKEAFCLTCHEEVLGCAKNQIADLEAKLAESENERELDNSFWKQECDGLQKALAEKTLTIEQINKSFIGNRSLWKGKYERANQDKISFAVEVLKIAQDYVQQYVNDFDDMNDCICAIDKLIKQLTNQHEDKGEHYVENN